MCRILIYGCPTMCNKISTEGTETMISCYYSKQEDIRLEKIESEILINHNYFPYHHQLIFTQSIKNEKLQTLQIKNKSIEPHEEFLENPEEEDGTIENHLEPPGKPSPDISTSSTSYKCEECGKILKARRTYRIHVKMHREKKFICLLCSRSFVVYDKLKRHMRKHAGEKAFACNFCPKSFDSRHNLADHVRTHTNERPFECLTCSKTFPSKSNLASHQRKHLGIKACVCEVCGKALSSMSSLKKHMKSHEDLKIECLVCRKTFSSVSIRDRHLKSHTGEKKHKCDFCDKAFVRRDHAKNHMTMHVKRGSGKL